MNAIRKQKQTIDIHAAKNLQDALNIAEEKFEEFLGSEIRGKFIMKQAEAT